MSSVNIQTISADSLSNQLPGNTYLFKGGRDQFSIASLSDVENNSVLKCFDDGVNILRKVAPNVYQDILAQRAAALNMASVAKGSLSSTGGTKPIKYPSEPGSIGVNWLFPQAVRYINVQSSSNPAYTDYAVDSWNIALTLNTLGNLLGSATLTGSTPPTTSSTVAINNFYKACSQNNQHEFWFVFQNGVIESGTTPALQQFNIQTQAANKYGVYATMPLNVQEAELEKPIYQYNTLGIIPVFFDLGLSWTALASLTQTSTIQLLGMVFYEHLLFPAQQLI